MFVRCVFGMPPARVCRRDASSHLSIICISFVMSSVCFSINLFRSSLVAQSRFSSKCSPYTVGSLSSRASHNWRCLVPAGCSGYCLVVSYTSFCSARVMGGGFWRVLYEIAQLHSICAMAPVRFEMRCKLPCTIVCVCVRV